MIYVTMMLMQSKERIDQLVWVIALSIGFYGVKGGIFTIVHGGIYHVRGPEGSFIGGDNEMGLALIMTIPLLRYLQLTARNIWLRGALTAAMVLCAIATVGSQSRGALLGLVAMGTFLWLKSRNKIFTAILGVDRHRSGALGDAAAVVRSHGHDTELRDRPLGHGSHQCLENGVQHGERQAAGRRLRLVPGVFVRPVCAGSRRRARFAQHLLRGPRRAWVCRPRDLPDAGSDDVAHGVVGDQAGAPRSRKALGSPTSLP